MSCPGHLPPGNDPVLIVQKVGSAPGPVWRNAENLPPPGFDPQTAQPIGNHYTNYAIPTHL